MVGLLSCLYLGGDVEKTRLVVVPLVEDNDCHKIKVAVLLQRATPSHFQELVVLPRLLIMDLLVLFLLLYPLVGIAGVLRPSWLSLIKTK